MQDVHGIEVLWTKILGILLILLGLMLFASPRIPYTTREEIAHTGLKVKREKAITIPRPVTILIIATGVLTLAMASRKSQQ